MKAGAAVIISDGNGAELRGVIVDYDGAADRVLIETSRQLRMWIAAARVSDEDTENIREGYGSGRNVITVHASPRPPHVLGTMREVPLPV